MIVEPVEDCSAFPYLYDGRVKYQSVTIGDCDVIFHLSLLSVDCPDLRGQCPIALDSRVPDFDDSGSPLALAALRVEYRDFGRIVHIVGDTIRQCFRAGSGLSSSARPSTVNCGDTAENVWVNCVTSLIGHFGRTPFVSVFHLTCTRNYKASNPPQRRLWASLTDSEIRKVYYELVTNPPVVYHHARVQEKGQSCQVNPISSQD